jgi:hypothetical protein
MDVLQHTEYPDGHVWFKANVGNREFDEIIDFAAHRKDYVKVDRTLLVNGVWVNGEKYISQFEFNKLQYELEEYQEVNGMMCSEIEGLKKEIESLKKYNIVCTKRNYDLNEEIQQIERVSDSRWEANINLTDTLIAAEEENQKLIDKNWELEKAYMHSRDYILSPDGEEWYKPMCVSPNILSTYYHRIPIGKVI